MADAVRTKRAREEVASPNTIALKKPRTGGVDAGGKREEGDEPMEFEVPKAWLTLSKEPTRTAVPSDVKGKFHAFILGDATLRKVKKTYGGTIGPLQQATTNARLEVAKAIQAEANRQARGLAGGGAEGKEPAPVVPRKIGSYFHVNPEAMTHVEALSGGGKTGDELDMEVEPIMTLVRKSVQVGKLNFATVEEAIESITPADVQEMVQRISMTGKGSRRRKKPAPPGGWGTFAFSKILQARIHDLRFTTRIDVEFRDDVPQAVMKKYDALRGGEVPQANTQIMDKYRTYLLAKREQQLRQADKKVSVTRGRGRMDGEHDDLLQFMLATKRRSQYFEPKISGVITPLYVRVKVRPPKFGIEPTIKWVLQHLAEEAIGDVGADDFMAADEAKASVFHTKLVDSFRRSFTARAKVETKPAELYVTVDYAKTDVQDGKDTRFGKVRVRG